VPPNNTAAMTQQQTNGSRNTYCSPATRTGASGLLPVFLLVLALCAAGGGAWWWLGRGEYRQTTDAILHNVTRSDFTLDVTERGEIQAGGVTEIKSQVKSKTGAGVPILRIVPEGSEVQEGDFLVELDSSPLQEERVVQKINYNTAQAALVEAKNLYDTAVIAKREYLEGQYVQERQVIESEVFVAEENLNRAKEYYAYSKKLAAKGYVNELQLEADRFAVEKSEKELAAAKTKLMVLDEFTKAKQLITLESAIVTAKAKWDSAQNSFDLEKSKLAEVEDQIAKCTMTAPRAGTVVFAHERNFDSQTIIKEGTVIREQQTIIDLPNPDSMQVEVSINESLVQFLKPGMPARIVPVGFGDQVLKGKVTKINQYAEPTGWRKANVKEYKAKITIEDSPPGIRPGMTASVTVLCEEIPDALQVPVQSVYAHGDKNYCFVFAQEKWEARPVECGSTNDKFYVINNGLQPGESVAMNPRRYVDQVKLPKIAPERMQRAVALGPEMNAEKPADSEAETKSAQAASESQSGG
jgi:HlyD family secretion protein